MALASSNRAQVRYVEEEQFGITPEVGTPKSLRMTGETLDFAITTETSQEIRSDRQTTDLVHTGASASGGINIELSYAEFDPFIEAALQGTWSHYGTDGVGVAADVTLDSDNNTLVWGSAPAGDDALSRLAPGDWLRVMALGDEADGFVAQIDEVSEDTLTLNVETLLPGQGSRVVSGAQIRSSKVENGTTQRSFTVEKEFEDVEQVFCFRGMTVSELSLSFSSGSILTGSITFMGKGSEQGTDTFLPGVAEESQTFEIMNAVTGVGNILEDGAPLTDTFFQSLTFNINNNLREQTAIGHLGAVSIAPGTLNASGDVEMYLADGNMYNKFRSNESTSLSFSAEDPSGNGYVFNIPNVKFSSMTVQAGGLDTDVMLSSSWQGLMDGESLKTVQIYRV